MADREIQFDALRAIPHGVSTKISHAAPVVIGHQHAEVTIELMFRYDMCGREQSSPGVDDDSCSSSMGSSREIVVGT